MSFLSRILPTRTPRPPIILDEGLVQSTGDYADYDCVQAVVNYVNTAQTKALMQAEELPLAAQEIYEVDRYMAQVNNGGHGQYWHNCGRHLAQMAPLVEGGLRAAKAKRHLKTFRHFVKEMRGQSPSPSYEISRQMSAHFSVLDDEFFRLEKSTPLSTLQAARVRAMKDLVLLPRDALQGAFADLADANPNFAARNVSVAMASVTAWFTSPQIFAAGYVLAQSAAPDLFGRLAGGGRIVQVDGEQGYLFQAETLNGRAVVIYHGSTCLAHEKLSEAAIQAEQARRAAGDVPQDGDPDFVDRMRALDGTGPLLGVATGAEVDALMGFAAEVEMGVATHALLERARITGPITHGGCLSTQQSVAEEGEMAVLLRVGERLVMALASRDGARLLSHDATEVLAEISAPELADRIETLRKA